MHKKALTVAFSAAVLVAAFFQTSHASALSPTSTASNQTTDQTVTVQPGDSLSKIATAKQTTYVRLFDANAQISDPSLIYPGQNITIPAPNEQLPDRMAALTSAASSSSASVSDTDNDSVAPATTATAVSAAPVSTPAAPAPAPSNIGVWAAIAQCESGGNWAADTGNGFYGGLQFTLSSWHAVGGSGYPNQASESEQIARAQALQAIQGWQAWPVCSVKAGV